MTKMKSVAGIICLVKELKPSIAFYEALGFEFKKHVPGVAATAYLNWFWIEFLLEDKVVTEEYKEDIAISPKEPVNTFTLTLKTWMNSTKRF